MMHTLPNEHILTEEDIERDADRTLARLIKGARVRTVATTDINFSERERFGECQFCDSGEKLVEVESDGGHAMCLSCTRATKYLQRCIDRVLKTMDQQRDFARRLRAAELKLRARRQRIKSGVAGRPGRKPSLRTKEIVMDAIRNGIAEQE